MTTKPTILLAADLPDWTQQELHALFDVIELSADAAAAQAQLKQHGPHIRGMALRKTKVNAALLDQLPALEIISSYSAGLDNVDVPAVKARGVVLENTSHVLAEDVANTALGLALAVTRDFINADAFVRSGRWPEHGHYSLGHSISRMKVGVVGMGTIGSAIARRLAAFGSQVAYYGPNRKPINLPYYDDVVRLAADCDMLILTCPLSKETHHLVNTEVLAALGPRGFLVNIARGPVVDEAALVAALANDSIAGAALDVFEYEPEVPSAFIQDRRLVLTPHIGSATQEARRGMAEHVVDTLARHFGLAGPRAPAAHS
ncbi:2-hydroxyacid dehydrogenase [Herbaspirillum sp. LeCh32-8]|uniref:2-hydroxyacid dehydrogenase n=1 Tax=Herbaspirillum sp. LeCh32-8 TaxID=2821356 RepID=UPI001AE694A9|nr:2-hydroxyacid dehydrogenase [Herbaspirillum sp. LeCh32-8]MBP0597783.1 2-hydroxyacid dehydrogenase [Herbaspirillum sp. LeCh32-8]